VADQPEPGHLAGRAEDRRPGQPTALNPETSAPLLAVQGLRTRFGGLWAVDGVTLDLGAGEILGLIGPNGSGKTTLLNTLNGVHAPDAGSIRLEGRSVAGLSPNRMAGLGVMRTFQAARVFETLTVGENMLLPTMAAGEAADEARQRAHRLLEEVGLEATWSATASELSGGQRKLIEFARSRINEPRVLLMDEPFAGVHPEIVAVMVEQIRAVAGRGAGVLLVSHEIPTLMHLAHRVICMSEARVIAEGSPAAVQDDEQVLEAYLGRPRDTRATS
jgi:ABC-type branched-subunit amino acid transport system ATPase component